MEIRICAADLFRTLLRLAASLLNKLSDLFNVLAETMNSVATGEKSHTGCEKKQNNKFLEHAKSPFMILSLPSIKGT